MARLKIETEEVNNEVMQSDLLALIPQYGQNKSVLDEVDKTCKAQNAKIKDLMGKLSMDSLTVDGWKATYSVSERTSMNEDKLLELLIHDWTRRNGSMECPYIKTKQYVDMDDLEKEMYAGHIPAELIADMKSCEETKKVETLRISKAKEKKNDK